LTPPAGRVHDRNSDRKPDFEARRHFAQRGTIMADAKNAAPAVPLAASGSGWQVIWGVLLIVSGILAVLMPGIAALATALIFAWLLIFGGAFEIVHAV
jgi:hypothetical protein